MLRVAALLLTATLLSGCATLTAASVATLLVTGAITGVGSYAGKQIASGAYKKHVAWKRCRQFRDDQWLLQQCVERYLYFKQRR
jgi:hypothetical protein